MEAYNIICSKCDFLYSSALLECPFCEQQACRECNEWKNKYEELELKRAVCCVRMERERDQLYEALNDLFVSSTTYEGDKEARLYVGINKYNSIRKLLKTLKYKGETQ